MVFQVVTDRSTRPAKAGRARIEFHATRTVEDAPVVGMQTETGSMRVSAPEVTAFDVVKFSEACGGLSNVATVLSELAERVDPAGLQALAKATEEPRGAAAWLPSGSGGSTTSGRRSLALARGATPSSDTAGA